MMESTNTAAQRETVHPTLGVEEEFLLVDPATGTPVMNNSDVIRTAERAGLQLGSELTPCQVETATPILDSARQLRANLVAMRSTAAQAAREHGARLLAVGVPPLAASEHPITDTDRYRRIAANFRHIADEQAICGCHVHVGVPDRATAIEVCNHLRPWLPTLLAISANSPISGGLDTGYASWRSIMWSRWPSAGPPPFLTSAEHYDNVMAAMLHCGAIIDEGQIYWDVRPSVRYPTVEVRVCDVPSTVGETVVLATLVRALVMTALAAIDRGDGAPTVSEGALRTAYWRAARDGISDRLVDPGGTHTVPAEHAVELLLRHTAEALEGLDEHRMVRSSLSSLFRLGNGAVRQRRVHAAGGGVSTVVSFLADATIRTGDH
ncbi:carboxylate-amine ligase [Rhodococcus cercidiphylli]|jgi:carboxylate-amine ligase|uniref:Putative glutamate--cysteine ligase 2 n=1 Tax=Rhodococcus cercidiphylli TaxID=489916 RepID=A0ABU4AV20_9NOCA|nr:glutamate--cysteine ligase [Rhodococcus cercidiphylli]MDV6230087.1 glutamate--cysteine ligase [Rhodococcus cercidiphylli]